MELGPEEILLLVSRDPGKTAARLAEVKARREAEARAKVARDAARLLRSANARFRKAERAEDPAEAARLRAEAEDRLKDLARVDPSAWPWMPWADAVRDTEVLTPADGQLPVFEGLKARIPGLDLLVEFGRVRDGKVGVRRAGSVTWRETTLDEVVQFAVRTEDLDPVWSEELDLRGGIERSLRYGSDWRGLGWSWGSDRWVERAWAEAGAEVVRLLAGTRGWMANQLRVPVANGRLRIARADGLSSGEVLPPTDAGWARFLELVERDDLPAAEVQACAAWWWNRTVPRRRS